MQKFGVLIVDDSALMRRAITLILEKDPQLFIVGVARNGREAAEKVKRLNPDVVTMDVEMPEISGLAALEQIMSESPVPVVMLSSFTDRGTQTTLDALAFGAVDFFQKESLLGEGVSQVTIQDFIQRVKVAAEARPKAQLEQKEQMQGLGTQEYTPKYHGCSIDLLIIGTSTGGPSALQTILPRIPAGFPVPVIVVQHMPPGFTKPLAERFDTICNLKVKEAEVGDELRPGVIYICPSGFQTILHRETDGTTTVRIQEKSPILTYYKPSVDVILMSAAPLYANRLLTVVLTGMGSDGLNGCKQVKENKGHVIVEAEESCVVYGMPKAVFEAGLADHQVPLAGAFHQIMKYVG